MAKLGEQLGKFGDDGRNALKAIIQAPKNAWLQLRGKGEFAASAATAAEKSGGVVGALTYLPKKSAKAALWIIEQPFAWAVKAARGGTKLIGGAYKKAPLLMVPLTVLGIGVGISSARHRNAENRAMENDMDQIAMAQQLAQAQQVGATPYAPAAHVTTTVNQTISPQDQVTAEDMARLNALTKGANGPKTGHADAVVAARQQAAPAASVAAL